MDREKRMNKTNLVVIFGLLIGAGGTFWGSKLGVGDYKNDIQAIVLFTGVAL